MIKDTLKELFVRDLKRLKKEIQLYKDESVLWEIENEIKNSGGNLCLHLIGNLKTFIGNGFADIGYTRKRDFEFAGKDVPREELYKDIDATITIVENGLDKITDLQFSEEKFPIKIWENETGLAFTIIHLHAHLNYHLGQINYHRRILDK